MRTLLLAAVAALAFQSAAAASTTHGPYHMSHGHCLASNGHHVSTKLCLRTPTARRCMNFMTHQYVTCPTGGTPPAH
ncbi:MAG TPA: hypothetical protein VHW60_19250 [Caulobacteraceae bacterium]|jgi:hypothetical protein|nr:hypothetical protein [Caulobacteraceae bacterium]